MRPSYSPSNSKWPAPCGNRGTGHEIGCSSTCETTNSTLGERRKAVERTLSLSTFLAVFFPASETGGDGEQSVVRADRLLANVMSGKWLVLNEGGVAKGVGVVELIAHLSQSDLSTATEAAARIVEILAPLGAFYEGEAHISFPTFRSDAGWRE